MKSEDYVSMGVVKEVEDSIKKIGLRDKLWKRSRPKK
jgi:hypothetical protein